MRDRKARTLSSCVDLATTLDETAHGHADPEDPSHPSRRSFLKRSMATGALLLAGGITPRVARATDDLGVASGNPRPDSVVLWTRVPNVFQTTASHMSVYWEIATTEAFLPGTLVHNGVVTTGASLDHTVRVRVDGLASFTTYYYRFHTASGYDSAVGRTLTAPHPEALHAELRFAFVSCSNYNGRLWNVYDALARRDDVHYCIHLGDSVYESSLGLPAQTLAEWRDLHKLYLSLPELQEVRRLFPWIHGWDDHEVFNNYSGEEMTEAERAIQTAAYQAFFEFMPLDPESPPTTENGITELRLYRQLTFGRLFEIFVTDGRQYRDGIVCGRELAVAACDDLYDPERWMLGREQTDWLKTGLDTSSATWKFVISATVMMAMKITNRLLPLFERMRGPSLMETSEGLVINLDQWDGYPENRRELLEWVEERGIDNLIVLSGDLHNCYAGRLKSDFTRRIGGRAVGVEFVTGSVTSDGIAETLRGYDASDLVLKAFQPANPHIDYVDAYHHVYTRVTVHPDQVRATWIAVDTISSPDYEDFELDTLIVPAGQTEVIVDS